MARKKVLRTGALNIALYEHAHGEQDYIKIFEYINSIEYPFQIQGNTRAIVKTSEKIATLGDESVILGTIFQFTYIDTQSDWLDLKTMKPVKEPFSEEIIQRLETLSPNLKMIPFAFFPKKHFLIYQYYYDGVQFSPNFAKKLFDNILSHDAIVDLFGHANVSHFRQKETLEKIFSLEKIKKLVIEIKRPNPSDFDGIDVAIQKRFEEENINEQVQILTPPKGESLQISPRIQLVSEFANYNGSVRGEGIDDDGRKKAYDTSDHNLIMEDNVDPKSKTSSPFHQVLFQAFSIVTGYFSK